MLIVLICFVADSIHAVPTVSLRVVFFHKPSTNRISAKSLFFRMSATPKIPVNFPVPLLFPDKQDTKNRHFGNFRQTVHKP